MYWHERLKQQRGAGAGRMAELHRPLVTSAGISRRVREATAGWTPVVDFADEVSCLTRSVVVKDMMFPEHLAWLMGTHAEALTAL